jgi:hypothetical protein
MTAFQDRLMELIVLSDELRDERWEDQFLTALAGGAATILSDAPQTGPDSWPYLMVQVVNDSEESVQKILAWLAERGIGLAINPQKEYPDFILSYGMIWNFRETGRFIDRRIQPRPPQFELEVPRHPASIEEKILPNYVRKILKEFFRDQGILRPRIALTQTQTDTQSYVDLAISLDSLKNPPSHEHQGIAEALGWFLPPHYSIIFLTESQYPHFEDL